MKTQMCQTRLAACLPVSTCKIRKIISAAQSIAERAALDFAQKRGIAHGGRCPAKIDSQQARRGRSRKQRLTKPRSNSCSDWLEWNVRNSEATVVFTIEEGLRRGCKRTVQYASACDKPWIHLAANRIGLDHAAILRSFILNHDCGVLNVVGSAEWGESGIGNFVTSTLSDALGPTMSPERTPTILILDDDRDVRTICSAMLEGYRVLEAEDSETALRLAKCNRLALVITDDRRPEKMDGLQFTAAMKHEHPTVPVLMVTGSDFADFRREAFQTGIHSFLGKPFENEQLLSAVDHVLSDVRYE